MVRSILLACLSLVATFQAGPTNWKTVTVVLERTQCFGMCPAYSVSVDQAGHVIYSGLHNVRVSGEQRATIAPAKVAALVAEIQRIRFFELKPVYTADVTDLPTTYVTVTLDGVSKRVTDYINAPEALRQLEKQIDAMTNSRRWVYVDPAVIKELQASDTPMSPDTLSSELSGAVSRDDLETSSALIAAGAYVKTTMRGKSPLLNVRSAAMVRLLVAAGAPVDSADNQGATALARAAAFQSAEVVEALLKAGASVDGVGPRVPLIWAAGNGNVTTVQLLLKAGANPRARNEQGGTALDEANRSCPTMARISETTPAGFSMKVTADDCLRVAGLLQAALIK